MVLSMLSHLRVLLRIRVNKTTQTTYNKMTEMKSDCDNNKCKAWVWSGKNGIISPLL